MPAKYDGHPTLMTSQTTHSNFYESDKAVSEYLLFHYGSESDLLYQGIGPKEALNFAQRCGQLHQKFEMRRDRALDLGCAVGGATFAMSESFNEVVGIDFSHALVEAASRLGHLGKMEISISLEGELKRNTEIALPADALPNRAKFLQGDAMDLDEQLGTFDFILMANLVDRLPDPARCLKPMASFLNKGGILAVTSPYTWLTEYTPKENWLGGFAHDGEPVRAADHLRDLLSPQFDFLEEQNLPFLIREHERKNQFSIAHATLWRKR
ncbi:MAG TPA: putative 4-mercaptohistidine N1-methyltransferase [Opitutae bacterium]|nr:putative 4-mercaptohistidine N1-methyltransferase [Opitutaceae bacterium]HCR30134.1 putative 4-mercaptohistidine N1-methyltransferase [Opitutae bacterium]